MAEDLYDDDGFDYDDEEEQEPVAEKVEEPKIMCFVSKKMVPISQTVELEYMAHKKVRVLPEYIKFDQEGAS